jgi:hypothetical protein
MRVFRILPFIAFTLEKLFAKNLPKSGQADEGAIGTFCVCRLPTTSSRGGKQRKVGIPQHDSRLAASQ